ncbi:MAG: hypothetical protein HZA90_19055 [Verrucomicrobia bacterium]|nr:hypothetical protein [Verrucomicrobiota bacterium]
MKKLGKVADLGDGAKQARCPACAEKGQDKKGEHLRIYPDGKFGCCVFSGDREHRRRIFALAGERVRQSIKVQVAKANPVGVVQRGILGKLGQAFATPTPTDAPDGVFEVESQSAMPDGPDGVGEVELQNESRTPRTGESESSGNVQPTSQEPRTGRTASLNSNGDLFDFLRTQRTPQYSYTCTPPTAQDDKEGVYKLKECGGGVRSVREGEGAVEPPEATGKKRRLPFLTPGGTLVIPFDSPARFHWWNGGQSVKETLAEVRRAMEPRKDQDAVTV